MAGSLRVEPATSFSLLVLIGGGEFSFGETREIDERLIQAMPADRRTIAFLPTASGSADYATHIGNYFRSIDPTVQAINVPVYRGRDARRQKNLNLIASAGMVYLGGGVTDALLDTLRESPAELALRDAGANGAVIAAIGAAAACFGTWTRRMHGSGSAMAGLAWLSQTVIDTGFDPADDTMLRRLMSTPGTSLGIGIPAGTALAIRGDGSTEVIGNGTIAVFRKSASP